MTGDDLDKLMEVMEAAFDPYWREAWTRRQVEESLILPSVSMTLIDEYGNYPESDSPAAGFTLSRKVLDEVELLLIGVRPEYRGHGLGQKLISTFIEKARSNGALKVFLEMRANNPAGKIYHTVGFKPIGRRKEYYRTLDGTMIDAITFAINF